MAVSLQGCGEPFRQIREFVKDVCGGNRLEREQARVAIEERKFDLEERKFDIEERKLDIEERKIEIARSRFALANDKLELALRHEKDIGVEAMRVLVESITRAEPSAAPARELPRGEHPQ